MSGSMEARLMDIMELYHNLVLYFLQKGTMDIFS